MPRKKRQGDLESENIRSRSGQSGQSQALDELEYIPEEERIEVEIRDIIRVKPSELAALKDSFEEWAAKWA